jgi:hypothetical protein
VLRATPAGRAFVWPVLKSSRPINAVLSTDPVRCGFLGRSRQGRSSRETTPLFDGSVQYTLASARNDTSGINSLPANNYDLASELGRADFDQRHPFDLFGRISAGKLANLGVALSLYSSRPYSLRTID